MALFLTATTDKIQIITSAAATVDVLASWTDVVTAGSTAPATGRQRTAITTATTTDVLAAPAGSTTRTLKEMMVRNKHASLSTDITVQYNDNATLAELYKTTLRAGETLQYVDGLGFFLLAPSNNAAYYNASTAQQAFASGDTYIAGSNIGVPTNLRVGSRYQLLVSATKTGAGTATPIFVVRYGTAGTTGDTARLTFTLNASTANADTATFTLTTHFRVVGASAVLVGVLAVVKGLNATTGIVNTVGQALQVVSGTFDSSVAASIIGTSLNVGTSGV